jgi:hypothetical protein
MKSDPENILDNYYANHAILVPTVAINPTPKIVPEPVPEPVPELASENERVTCSRCEKSFKN